MRGLSAMRWLAAAAAATVFAAAGGTAAFADQIVLDGDGVAPVTSNSTVSVSACTDKAVQFPVLIAALRQGGSAGNNFKSGSTVTVSIGTATAGMTGLLVDSSNPNVPDQLIQLPNDWESLDNSPPTAGTDTVTAIISLPAKGAGGTGSVNIGFSGPSVAGGTRTGSAQLTVAWTTQSCAPSDTTPPTLVLPQDTTVEATGPTGAVVNYSASATDAVSPANPPVTCVPASGSTFALGSTVVSCTATDAAGNTGAGSFIITVQDTTAPTITFQSRTPGANPNGWNNTDVVVTWTCSDAVGVTATTVSDTVSTEGEDQAAHGTCTDVAGNTTSATESGINIDKTAPVIALSDRTAANANGWNNGDVTVTWSCTDTGSGAADATVTKTLNTEGADQSATGTCTDKAGNTAAATEPGINIDKTAPSVALVGGPTSGAGYYFGQVPVAPTCDSSDTLSGLDGSCVVSGYSTAVGTHTVTATAKDKAGNTAAASATYEVKAWTLGGFYAPVDVDKLNTVKGGSTVPLKFEVFAGDTELTDTAAVQGFTVKGITCPDATTPADDIELVTTGGTSLRYDTTGGQFIQNWQTPKKSGACYNVTMATEDGSSLSATFKLK